jgi:hypothetical protein
MYNLLLIAHNGLRWLFLAAALYAIFRSVKGLMGNGDYTPADNKAASFVIIFAHTQLLSGLILWFVSPTVQTAITDMGAAMKDKLLRLALLEHPLTNIISIVIIQIGRIQSKKAYENAVKHKRILMFYGIGLILILSRIPWANSPLFRY